MFIVDGIIGQEEDGTIESYAKKCGGLLLGLNLCAVDYVAAKIVGLDYPKKTGD